MSATQTADPLAALGIERSALPRHIAIIMDGNGRWARERGFPRLEGHRRGAEAVRTIVTECARLGIECLTLYSFSIENWKRPPAEVEGLMALYAQHLVAERPEIMQNNIRLVHIGRAGGLPEAVRRELQETQRLSSANTGMALCLALNYGARAEIVDAIQELAERVAAGKLRPEQIDEAAVSGALDTAGLPDPDLLVRTAGEMRLSNFLLWQISYAELWVTPESWPEFGVQRLHEAIRAFAHRERRYGDVAPPAQSR